MKKPYGLKIKAANEIALGLWEGHDLLKGKKNKPDDRVLLSSFSQRITQARAYGKPVNINKKDVDSLMSVARLGLLHLAGNINYEGISEWFNKYGSAKRIAAVAYPNSFSAACGETLRMLNELADLMHDKSECKHIILASRILFFALPQLPFFNISGDVAKLLEADHKTDEGLQAYWQKQMDLLYDYEKSLTACARPKQFKNHRNHISIRLAVSGGWWHRRVLDLALMAAANK